MNTRERIKGMHDRFWVRVVGTGRFPEVMGAAMEKAFGGQSFDV